MFGPCKMNLISSAVAAGQGTKKLVLTETRWTSEMLSEIKEEILMVTVPGVGCVLEAHSYCVINYMSKTCYVEAVSCRSDGKIPSKR